MSKIRFENGSIIEAIYQSSGISRGSRSTFITFYCKICKNIHSNYPVLNVLWDGDSDNPLMCKESFEKVLEPYINTEQSALVKTIRKEK